MKKLIILILYVILIALYGCAYQSLAARSTCEVGNGSNNNDEINSGESEPAYSPAVEVRHQPDAAEYISYINDVLPRYFGSTLESKNDYSSTQISQGFIVNGNPDENSRTFFIADNGEYIGLLFVTNINGIFHSSFGLDDNENITAAIRNSVPIALFVLDIGAVFVQTEDSEFQLTAFENPDDIQMLFPAAFETRYDKMEIILSDLYI